MLDDDGTFPQRCNTSMVQIEPVLAEAEQEGKVARGIWHLGQADEAVLKRLVENHARYTGSVQAAKVLERWSEYRGKFVKIFPHEYRRALGDLAAKGGKLAA